MDWKNTRVMAGSQHYQWRHQCDQCDYKNKNHFNLKYHLKSHTRNQRFKCPLCSFSSHFKFYTDRHLSFQAKAHADRLLQGSNRSEEPVIVEYYTTVPMGDGVMCFLYDWIPGWLRMIYGKQQLKNIRAPEIVSITIKIQLSWE